MNFNETFRHVYNIFLTYPVPTSSFQLSMEPPYFFLPMSYPPLCKINNPLSPISAVSVYIDMGVLTWAWAATLPVKNDRLSMLNHQLQ